MAVSRKPIARPESSITEEKRTTRLKTIVFGSILLLSVWGLFEGVARVAVWSDSPLFKPIRRAPYFAPYDSENYQKLNAYFASGAEDATIPDPELGWVGTFSATNYQHHNISQQKERRPVLLLGDSFANGMGSTQTIEASLNENPDFAGSYYLLNYAVDGYGLDQIYLLLKKVINRVSRSYHHLQLHND